jgi:hypothetical protein
MLHRRPRQSTQRLTLKLSNRRWILMPSRQLPRLTQTERRQRRRLKPSMLLLILKLSNLHPRPKQSMPPLTLTQSKQPLMMMPSMPLPKLRQSTPRGKTRPSTRSLKPSRPRGKTTPSMRWRKPNNQRLKQRRRFRRSEHYKLEAEHGRSSRA